ncbi:cytochrome P450 family protein [Tasmannia lanceolata]|uniref:cytochrome P450 family protein n=1 Tax=Tasmannia lanceolata TaxID=3420 RepID=UPI0040647507
MFEAMTVAAAPPCWPRPTITAHTICLVQLRTSSSWKIPRPKHGFVFPLIRLKHPRLPCTKLSSWEPSPLTYAPNDNNGGVTEGTNILESIIEEATDETSIPENGNGSINMKKQSSMQSQPLKWPMWLLGPSVLLATGMVPTLWLPLSSVFLGPNIAGLLSLVGLDCIFNMGATLFLLMADACARPKSTTHLVCNCQVPLSYKFWNMGVSLIGFVIPLMMLLASYRTFSQPQLPFISFAVLLGPYLLLLSIQMLTEMLTWHWKSPVWLLTPIVYESYRVLQLMRGLRLGVEVGAPTWVLHCTRGLVSWWVLILGVQLMRVAWFAGLASRTPQH